MKDKNPLVYSTDYGRICPKCSNPIAECSCKKPETIGSGKVRIRKESKGRKGKIATVITGIPLKESELSDLCKKLKQKCGCGGTVKNGNIEIQGDRVEILLKELQAYNWDVKKSG